MRIALVKLSSMGDIIHLGLLIPSLKRALPALEIEWLIDESFAPLLQDSPFVSKIHALPLRKIAKNHDFKALFTLIKTLKNLQTFDLLIDAQGLIKSALISRLIPAHKRVGFDKNSAKEGLSALFYDKGIAISYSEHILKRNATLLSEAFEIPLLEARDFTEMFIPSQSARERVNEMILPGTKKRILFVLEASKANKIYPRERFLELSRLCEREEIYLLWHENVEHARYISSRNHALILLERLTLSELKAFILRMNAVIGGDTGVTHLAFALGIPTITLFGNTPIERFALKKEWALRSENARDYDKRDCSIGEIEPARIRALLEEIL